MSVELKTNLINVRRVSATQLRLELLYGGPDREHEREGLVLDFSLHDARTLAEALLKVAK